MTGIDERVKEVGGDVQGVSKKVQDVDDRVQGVDKNASMMRSRVSMANWAILIVRHLLIFLLFHSEFSDLFAGNLFRDNLLRWLSPSDPSTNHNIASKAHHHGTAQWFFQGSIFNEWKSAGSFLWVHGKRVFLLVLNLRYQA